MLLHLLWLAGIITGSVHGANANFLMSLQKFPVSSLVLYKIRPALVTEVADKIEIQFDGGKSKRVREKDILLLHPGPVRNFDFLQQLKGDVKEAWELMQGEQASLAEVAELVYGEYTPAAAWCTWELLKDGLYFDGSVKIMRAKSAETVAEEQQRRESKEAEQRAEEAFLQRLAEGSLHEEDRQRLVEVERVAIGQSDRSRILANFDLAETPAVAHQFLVRCGYWPENYNPWPLRQGANLLTPELAVPDLPEEDRVDMTHLEAYAIDDEGSNDPDDAISFDGDRLWVHVADVAALVKADSHLDLAARERGANLYLPEGIVGMLPEAVTTCLGLGLQSESPAFSIGFRLAEDASVRDVQIVLSRIKVIRGSYAEMNQRLDEPLFANILRLTRAYREARLKRDAAQINLPEASVKVAGDEVIIRPLPDLDSRQMVTDAMLMAGEAAARFASENQIPIPYAVQPVPEEIRRPETMAEAYAYRRMFKPSNAALTPDRHFGLGLEIYTRATSPLRRYLDLITHQQIRAFLQGRELLSQDDIALRIGASGAVTGTIRRAERLSNLHWKLVYLKQRPDWKGEAIVVALEERKAVVVIPEIALESRVRLKEGMELDQRLKLALREVDLAAQTVYFQVLN